MTLRRRIIRILLIFLLFPPLLAGIAGWLAAPSFLHPIRRELTPDLIREADTSFANLREASYDYAGFRRSPLLGMTLFRPFSWTLLYRGEKLTGIPLSEISPEKAVAARPFPVLLICDEKDAALPCRHTRLILAAARGPKEFWEVPGAFHTAAIGFQPAEFQRRVLDFFANVARSHPVQ